jgi:thiol:disulfide interchange protein DsbA
MRPCDESFRLMSVFTGPRATLSLLLLLLSCAPASGSDERPGYAELDAPAPASQGDQIEVVQVFWYGCPDCQVLEARLDGLLDQASQQISLRRMPAIAPRWEPHARAFYAAASLGELERFHSALGEAMQRDRRRLMSDAQLIVFASEIGLDAEAFAAAMDSPEVERQVQEAAELTDRYGITAVPALVINGRYRTDLQLAGEASGMIETASALIQRERAPSSERHGRNRARR